MMRIFIFISILATNCHCFKVVLNSKYCIPTQKRVEIDNCSTDECYLLKNSFESLSKLDGEFFDFNLGTELNTFYSNRGDVFFTDCQRIEEVDVKEKVELCTKDVFIEFQKDGVRQQAFLTKKNIIRDFKDCDCEIVDCNNKTEEFLTANDRDYAYKLMRLGNLVYLQQESISNQKKTLLQRILNFNKYFSGKSAKVFANMSQSLDELLRERQQESEIGIRNFKPRSIYDLTDIALCSLVFFLGVFKLFRKISLNSSAKAHLDHLHKTNRKETKHTTKTIDQLDLLEGQQGIGHTIILLNSDAATHEVSAHSMATESEIGKRQTPAKRPVNKSKATRRLSMELEPELVDESSKNETNVQSERRTRSSKRI